MNSQRVRNVIFFLIICTLLVLTFVCYNQYSKAKKLSVMTEVANSNTLSSVSRNIDNIHSILQNQIFADNVSTRDLNSEIALLLIQEEIKDIEVVSRSFVRSGDPKYWSDSNKLGRLSMGLLNYFQDIGRLEGYSQEKKDQLLLNLKDLRYKILEFQSNNEYSTEERLHFVIIYIQEYDGWEKSLKRRIFDAMFY